jgi:hypothetical protein
MKCRVHHKTLICPACIASTNTGSTPARRAQALKASKAASKAARERAKEKA